MQYSSSSEPVSPTAAEGGRNPGQHRPGRPHAGTTDDLLSGFSGKSEDGSEDGSEGGSEGGSGGSGGSGGGVGGGGGGVGGVGGRGKDDDLDSEIRLINGKRASPPARPEALWLLTGAGTGGARAPDMEDMARSARQGADCRDDENGALLGSRCNC